MIAKIRHIFYRYGIQPRSKDLDDQRREVVFNIVISIISVMAILATISSVYNHLVYVNHQGSSELPTTIGFLIFVMGLWAASRRRHYHLAAYGLVGAVWLMALQLMLGWSFALPIAQLINILVVILAGILLRSRASTIISFITSTSIVAIGYLQVHGYQHPDTSWLTQPLLVSDALGLAMIVAITAGISWLANKQIDAALARAQLSEAALTQERDLLEVTVAKRTKQLEEAQYEKLLEVERLAEFGRFSASLVHDLADPLAAASLSLERAKSKSQSEVVKQAVEGLRHLEDYLVNARDHLRGHSSPEIFKLEDVARKSIKLLQTQAQSKHVSLSLKTDNSCTVYGDAVAMQRVISNMIQNGVDACVGLSRKDCTIVVRVWSDDGNSAQLSITDNGRGIKPAELPHIFEKFYSTKQHTGRDMGLGLYSVKHVVENDFGGQIIVTSQPKIGTCFTIQLAINNERHKPGNSSGSRVSK